MRNEADQINQAYQQRVRSAYAQLCDSLEIPPEDRVKLPSGYEGMPEDRFRAALQFARRAREIALKILQQESGKTA